MKFTNIAVILGALASAVTSTHKDYDKLLHFPCKNHKECNPEQISPDFEMKCDTKTHTLKVKGQGECRYKKEKKCYNIHKKFEYDFSKGRITKEQLDTIIETCQNGYFCKTGKGESYEGECKPIPSQPQPKRRRY